MNTVNITSDYEFCIVVPLYNEEENIGRLGQELGSYLNRSPVKTCVLFIDDGSTDKSREYVSELCSKHSGFYYQSFAQNRGLSAAIKSGIDTCQASFVGYIDADLQTTPEDFSLLLPYRHEYEMVMGIRTGRKDSFGKRVSSKFANGFRRMMTHDGIEDTGCPLKIIRTDYAKRIPLFNGMHRFLPALLQLQQGRVKQIPVRHFERLAGKSKFHLWNRLTGPFMDCFAFRWMKKRYISYTIGNTNVRPLTDGK